MPASRTPVLALADPTGSQPAALTIRINPGTGAASTPLAAFDAALRGAGVGDFNLVRLSSIIPPGSVVEPRSPERPAGTFGDIMFCVYAEGYTETPGETAWAGISWARNRDGSGSGLMVEQHGETQESVECALRESLSSLIASRPGHYRPEGTVLSSITCEDRPVCAMVVASYRSLAWAEVSR